MPKISIFESEENLHFPFVAVDRVDIKMFDDMTVLQKRIHQQCVVEGKPLVISNMHTLSNWKSDVFDLNHLMRESGGTIIDVFDSKDKKIIKNQKLADFIQVVNTVEEPDCNTVEPFDPGAPDDVLTVEDERTNTKPQGRGRFNKKRTSLRKKRALYAKDISCSKIYQEALHTVVPEFLLPLGSQDLFACLDKSLRAENLMCYLGNNGTGTPLHRDICGTFGHNMMTYANPGAYAEWYIVERHHRKALSQALQPRKTNGEELRQSNGKRVMSSFLESDRAWIFQNMYKNLDLNVKTHVVIQRLGDLVLIPSLCYHQVRNAGVSMKVAWNRSTAHTLRLALEDQLPIYRKIVRPEIYRCKAMVLYTLRKWMDTITSYQLAKGKKSIAQALPTLLQNKNVFLEDCRILLHLYETQVIAPEIIESIELEGVDCSGIVLDNRSGYDAYTSTCDFCQCDIFYRYYHCDMCEGYDLCLDCYSQGRSCQHMDQMVMHQCSAETLEEYLGVYTNFIQCVNKVFNEKCLFSRLTSESTVRLSSQYSLATICRRIERYRLENGPLSNLLMCGHCRSVCPLFTPHSKNLEIYSIFGRKSCYLLNTATINSTVFTCEECTKRCNGCQPLPKQQHDRLKMVYYQEPDLDQRNWGNLNDKGIYMSCHWPDRISAQTGRDESETLAHGRQYESIDEIQGRAAAALIRCLTQNALNTFYERQGAQEVARCVTETAKAWAADIKKDLQRQPHEEDEQMTLFIPTDKRLWRKKAEVFVDMKKVSVNIPRAMTVKRKQRTENEAESAPTNVSGDKEEEKQKFKDEFPVIPCIILTPRQEKIKKKVEEQRQAKEEELSLQSTKQKRQKRLRMK